MKIVIRIPGQGLDFEIEDISPNDTIEKVKSIIATRKGYRIFAQARFIPSLGINFVSYYYHKRTYLGISICKI